MKKLVGALASLVGVLGLVFIMFFGAGAAPQSTTPPGVQPPLPQYCGAWWNHQVESDHLDDFGGFEGLSRLVENIAAGNIKILGIWWAEWGKTIVVFLHNDQWVFWAFGPAIKTGTMFKPIEGYQYIEQWTAGYQPLALSQRNLGQVRGAAKCFLDAKPISVEIPEKIPQSEGAEVRFTIPPQPAFQLAITIAFAMLAAVGIGISLVRPRRAEVVC